MRRSCLLLFTFFIMLIPVLLYSQPRCIMHLYGGFMYPTAQLGTNPSFAPSADYYLERNYGMKFGVNFLTGDVKFAFDKKRHIRGVMGVSLNVFTNPKEVLTLGFSSLVRTTINITSLHLGGEYAFIPADKFSPFAGVGLTANFISGDDFSSQTRYGLRITCGADFEVKNNWGAVAGISYDNANVMGKTANISSLKYGAPELPLNDAEFTHEGNTISAKTISYVQLYLGFSLFLGKPEK